MVNVYQYRLYRCQGPKARTKASWIGFVCWWFHPFRISINLRNDQTVHSEFNSCLLIVNLWWNDRLLTIQSISLTTSNNRLTHLLSIDHTSYQPETVARSAKHDKQRQLEIFCHFRRVTQKYPKFGLEKYPKFSYTQSLAVTQKYPKFSRLT